MVKKEGKTSAVSQETADVIGKSGMSEHLLIPVDFSEASKIAVEQGFRIAAQLNILPVLLHVYPAVWFGENMDADITGVYADHGESIEKAIEEKDLHDLARRRLDRLRGEIDAARKAGTLPDIKFTSLLQEGIPEDVILDYCRENTPKLVVMATRSHAKKEADLIGSVTAEVLDSCRVPVFTVPDNFHVDGKATFDRVLMFCTLDRYDLSALDRLMATFGNCEMEIWLMPLSSHHNDSPKLRDIRLQLEKQWSTVKFHEARVENDSIDSWMDNYIKRNKIEIIIAPNRKMSIFTRLFRPSVAHQCLFTLDLPMVALPVSKG